MDTIKVNIDVEEGTISVYNNGRGIPIEVHSQEKMYIPELIFGHLLSSSNYDDDEKKLTGGRNGYGAKLANIYSPRVHCRDCRQKFTAEVQTNLDAEYEHLWETQDHEEFQRRRMDQSLLQARSCALWNGLHRRRYSSSSAQTRL